MQAEQYNRLCGWMGKFPYPRTTDERPVYQQRETDKKPDGDAVLLHFDPYQNKTFKMMKTTKTTAAQNMGRR